MTVAGGRIPSSQLSLAPATTNHRRDMATLSVRSVIEQARTAPLPLGAVAATALVVWLAGAIYCSGYEMLLTGLDNWPGSLWWSAVAVLPWFALFEWSKSERGRRSCRPKLIMTLMADCDHASSGFVLQKSFDIP